MIYLGFPFCFSHQINHNLRKNLFLLQVIDYCTLPVGNPVAEGRRALIRNMWNERMQGVKQNVEVEMFCCYDYSSYFL